MKKTRDEQTANAVLMIRPHYFSSNAETSATNAFQEKMRGSKVKIQKKAVAEFDAVVKTLQKSGVRVHVFEDSTNACSPDAVFPNNWVSFHPNGTAVLFPMLAPSRRKEVRRDILKKLEKQHHYSIERTLDLTPLIARKYFLEGTGSVVLDHVHRIAYACISPRTTLNGLKQFSQKMGYKPVTFHAYDEKKKAIYHTNVLMSIGQGFCVICLGSIADSNERELVEQSIHKSGREIIPITLKQMTQFAGNIIELKTSKGEVIVMSAAAEKAFTNAQLKTLKKYGRIVSIPIPTIEKYGGGSVRCMLAEIFSPKK